VTGKDFVQHTALAPMDIIKVSHQPPETASDALAGNQNKRTEVNYENSSFDMAIRWVPERTCLCAHTEEVEKIICDLIDGASDITGKVQFNSKIESSIDDERLRDEKCAYLAIVWSESICPSPV
jgi:hypothetical protein